VKLPDLVAGGKVWGDWVKLPGWAGWKDCELDGCGVCEKLPDWGVCETVDGGATLI